MSTGDWGAIKVNAVSGPTIDFSDLQKDTLSVEGLMSSSSVKTIHRGRVVWVFWLSSTVLEVANFGVCIQEDAAIVHSEAARG